MERPFDMVIFGASGFTGKYVVREALKFLNAPGSPLKTMALAGRSPDRISDALRWACSPETPPPLPIIQADVSSPPSLLSLCRQTRLLLHCVGPFRLYGQPVAAACVEAATDYLDVCGEADVIERMEVDYHEEASRAGCLLVSACGFDCMPAELGFMFNSKLWVPPAVPVRVQAYLSLESDKKIAFNNGTYESLVLGAANSSQLEEFRKSRARRHPPPVIPGPSLPNGPLLEHQKELGLWSITLPTADAVLVQRTLMSAMENPTGLAGVNESKEQVEKRKAFWATIKPVHFDVKFGMKSFLGIVCFIIIGIFIGLFSRFSFGRSLLLKHPELFSFGTFRKKGPSEEEINSASFKMWFVGEGYSDGALCSKPETKKPDTQIITRVSGFEVGYVTTPIVLLQCALIVLGQRANLPRGGVYTPGTVFGPTDLQERLQENGISFEVISKKNI